MIHDLPRGQSLVERLIDTKATFVLGVPTHAIDLLAEMRARGLKKLGCVKGFRISGASVPPSVAAGLLAHGVTPQSGFGMTEAGSHHYTLPHDDAAHICETSGRACATYEVKIFSGENPDIEVFPGEIGQIGGRGARPDARIFRRSGGDGKQLQCRRLVHDGRPSGHSMPMAISVSLAARRTSSFAAVITSTQRASRPWRSATGRSTALRSYRWPMNGLAKKSALPLRRVLAGPSRLRKCLRASRPLRAVQVRHARIFPGP